MRIRIGEVIEMARLREIFFMFLGFSIMFVETAFASEKTTVVTAAVTHNQMDIYVQALFAGLVSLTIIFVLWIIVFKPKINHKPE